VFPYPLPTLRGATDIGSEPSEIKLGKAKGKHMKRELRGLVNRISDKGLKKKVIALIEGSAVEIGDAKYEGLPIEASPAAVRGHHSYPEGLLQHMIASATIALTLCQIIQKTYHGKVNRDVVLAAIIAHDLMKPLVYLQKEDGTYRMSPLGERIDHLTLIVSELIRRGFPLDVIHAVTAHHGQSSPISPRTVEALVCFVSDYADATLNGETLNAARFLVRDCVSEEAGPLTAEQAFAIVYAKQTKGCEGVVEELEKIREENPA